MSKNKVTVTEEITLPEPAPAAALATTGQFDNEFEDDARALDQSDVVVARLKLVQGLTQGKREHNLQDGQIYNTSNFTKYDSLIIVPVHENRVVVERAGEDGKGVKKGQFVAEHSLDSATVKQALARNDQKYDKNLKTLEGNTLEETRNIHVALLDDDGVSVKGFGVLVATSTNLFPVRQWLTDRGAFQRTGGKAGTTLPEYAFRTVVDGKGVHKKNQTALYRFNPYRNNSWKDSAIDPDTATESEINLLRALKAHKALIKGGTIKVAEYTADDVNSEDAAEAAAF